MKKFCEYLIDDSVCMIDGEPCEFEDGNEASDLCGEFSVPDTDLDDEQIIGIDGEPV